MSGCGRMRAQLEAERRERIRLDQVREECNGMLHAARSHIQKMTKTQHQLGAAEIGAIRQKMSDAEKSIVSSPDAAKEELQDLMQQVVATDIRTRRETKEWDEGVAQVETLSVQVRLRIESLAALSTKMAQDSIAQLRSEFDHIVSTSYSNEEKRKAYKDIGAKAAEVATENENELVRREVLRSIRKTLRTMGFTPSKPKLQSKDGRQVVRMVGVLPSGRSAVFHVHIDGTTEFDFEGYHGSACKDSLDTLMTELRKEEVEGKVTQFVWHNPDRLEKGEMDLPYGGRTQSKGV